MELPAGCPSASRLLPFAYSRPTSTKHGLYPFILGFLPLGTPRMSLFGRFPGFPWAQRHRRGDFPVGSCFVPGFLYCYPQIP